MTTKRCTKCGEVKALNAFSLRSTESQKRRASCKRCACAATRKRLELKNPGVKKLAPRGSHAAVAGLKRCNTCAEVKSTDNFYRDKGKKDGFCCSCKACSKARSSAWRKANPGRSTQHVIAFRARQPDLKQYNNFRAALYRTRHRETWLRYERERQRRQIKELGTSYVKSRIDLPADQIPPELIAAKRAFIKLSRKIKEKTR